MIQVGVCIYKTDFFPQSTEVLRPFPTSVKCGEVKYGDDAPYSGKSFEFRVFLLDSLLYYGYSLVFLTILLIIGGRRDKLMSFQRKLA